jgi:hypothetical protein
VGEDVVGEAEEPVRRATQRRPFFLENQGFTPVPFHRNETAPQQQIQQLKTKSAT